MKAIKNTIVYIITFSSVVLFTALLFFILSFRDRDDQARSNQLVTVVKPSISSIHRFESFNSYIKSESTVACVPLVSGKIDDFLVKAGDVVKKDDEIAIIDKDSFELEYNQAKAAFDGYDSSLSRVSNLYEIGAVSKQNYDEVKAQRDAYKARMELAQLQLSYSRVKSPSTGTVLTTLSAKGDTISSGTPIAIIGDLEKLEVDVNADENLLGFIAPGQRVEIVHKNINATCYGHVDLVEPYVDPKTKSFKATCKIDDIKDEYKQYFIPGCAVKVNIVISEKQNVPIVDLANMTSDDVVYMINPQDPEKRVIAVKPDLFYRNDTSAAIDTEYKNYYLVVKGQHKIYSDMKVDYKLDENKKSRK